MGESPSGKCGYIYPEDYEVGANPYHQSCCYRDTVGDTGRCPWHVNADETDKKTVEELQAVRVDADLRNQTQPAGELLSGANLVGVEIHDLISFCRVGLGDADLTEADLRDADLTEADLRDADLTEADLRDADLTDAYLAKADLTDAYLFEVNLTDAYLAGADLTDENLQHADMTGAEIQDANLIGATLRNADLAETNLKDGNLFNANLAKADLSNANLANADLTEAGLQDGNLSNANLAKVSLTEADLQDGNLSNANLAEADLSNANLAEANLTEADLRDADLTDADLAKANLTETTLMHAVCSGTNMRSVKVKPACTRQNPQGMEENESVASLEDAQLENRTDLRGAELSGMCLYQTAFRDVRINNDTTFGIDDNKPGTACRYEYDPSATVSVADEDFSRWKAAAWTYRRLESLFEENAMDQRARNAHIRKEEAQREDHRQQVRDWTWLRNRTLPSGAWLRSLEKSTLSWLNWRLHRHGESLRQLLKISATLIVVCGTIYSVAGVAQENPETTYQLLKATSLFELATDLLNGLYFSVITFSTIGYGDFYPASPLSRLLVGIESLAGALFIALFVFVIGRRVAR